MGCGPGSSIATEATTVPASGPAVTSTRNTTARESAPRSWGSSYERVPVITPPSGGTVAGAAGDGVGSGVAAVGDGVGDGVADGLGVGVGAAVGLGVAVGV